MEKEVKEARMAGQKDDGAEILNVLAKTKLELAQAEDEKIELMFVMKSERAIQERLAATRAASRSSSAKLARLLRNSSGKPAAGRRRPDAEAILITKFF